MLKQLLKKKKSNGQLYCPVSGVCINIDEVDDEMFSQRMMGDGFAIEPECGEIYAPCDGVLTMVYPSAHAFGIKTDEYEILIHIGIDTVELNGEGFHTNVKQGDSIKAGDKLVDIDLELIRNHGFKATCIVIFTNGEKINNSQSGNVVKAKEELKQISIMK